jgi:hypothetical protein
VPEDVADEEPVSAGAVADDPDEVASPRTDTALPPAVTGTSAETGAWMPEAMPSDPADVALDPPPAAGSLAAGAGAAASDPVLAASPRTLTALPPTVTGTLTSATAWSPDSTPLMEAGETVAEGAAGAAGADADESELDESPRTEIPLPATDTGTVRPTTAWSPVATPSPLGSAAFAAAVPASQSPPTQRVNHIPLDTYLFIVQPFK